MPGGSGGSCRFGQSSGSAGSDRPSGLSGCGDGWVFLAPLVLWVW